MDNRDCHRHGLTCDTSFWVCLCGCAQRGLPEEEGPSLNVGWDQGVQQRKKTVSGAPVSSCPHTVGVGVAHLMRLLQYHFHQDRLCPQIRNQNLPCLLF